MIKDKRTAEEWGRVAVSLPGWRWMPGMQPYYRGCRSTLRVHDPSQWGMRDAWPDPDDPATAGCLLALLGHEAGMVQVWYDGARWRPNAASPWVGPMGLGRACIAAAEALGRWPGGGE